jgi:hypothetical protein
LHRKVAHALRDAGLATRLIDRLCQISEGGAGGTGLPLVALRG